MVDKKFFHNLTANQYDNIIGKVTWGKLKEHFKQPDWCGYPDALSRLGCWSLTGNHISKESDCYTCELHKKESAIHPKKFDVWIEPETKEIYVFGSMLWVNKSFLEKFEPNECIPISDKNTMLDIISKYELAGTLCNN